MKIQNVSGEMITFMLTHDVVCSAGVCRCTYYRRPGSLKELRIPASLMIAAGHCADGDEAVGLLPEVGKAVALGKIKITADRSGAVDEPSAQVDEVHGEDVSPNRRTRRTPKKVRT